MWSNLRSFSGSEDGNEDLNDLLVGNDNDNDNSVDNANNTTMESLDTLLNPDTAPPDYYASGSSYNDSIDTTDPAVRLRMSHSQDTTVAVTNQAPLLYDDNYNDADHDDEDDDYDDDYVPPGLASFVQEANQRLKQQQMDFMMASIVTTTDIENVHSGLESPQHAIQEDQHDMELKKQVLDRLGVNHYTQEQPVTATKNVVAVPVPVAVATPEPKNTFMSPDLLRTPPPNPAAGITDSEAKRGALEGSSPVPTTTQKPSFAARLESSLSEQQQQQPVSTTATPPAIADLADQPDVEHLTFKAVQESPERYLDALLPETATSVEPPSPSLPLPAVVKATTPVTLATAVADVSVEKDNQQQVLQAIPPHGEAIVMKAPPVETAKLVATPAPEPVVMMKTLPVEMEKLVAAPAPVPVVMKTPSVETEKQVATPVPVPVGMMKTPPLETEKQVATQVPVPVGMKTPPVETEKQVAAPAPVSSTKSLMSSLWSAVALPPQPERPVMKSPPPPPPAVPATPVSVVKETLPTAASKPAVTTPTPVSTPIKETATPVSNTSTSKPVAATPIPALVPVPFPSFASPISVNTPTAAPASTKNTPSPRNSATVRGSSASRVSPNVTTSASRLLRPTTASAKKVTTAPGSVSKESPRVTPKASADRLSRPTTASAVRAAKSPPLHGKTAMPSSLGSVSVSHLTRPTAASAVRTSTTKRSPLARNPVVSTRTANPASAPPPVSSSVASSVVTRKVPHSTSGGSRLLQGTAASRARGPSAAAEKSKALAEDGRAKARERIRQRMLQQQQPEKKTSRSALQSEKPGKVSVNHGIARARERVRQRQLQQKAAVEKENSVRTNATSIRRSSGVSSSGPTRSRTGITIPHGPKFATDAKYGEKKGGKKEAPSLAQSGDVMRRGLRGEDKPPPTRAPRSRAGLTIPVAPKFATTSRYGEKALAEKATAKPEQPSLAQSSDSYTKHLRDDMSVSSIGSKGSRNGLTIPCAPKFASSARHGEPETPKRVSSSDQTLAQSSDNFGKGLRDSKIPISTVKRTPGPTIPRAPRLHHSVQRGLPQSAAEKEEEMMEYYHSHPFRANPVLTHVSRAQRPPMKVNTRRMTAPVPFHFKSEERSASAKRPIGSPNKEDEDVEEMKHQFHARAMPTFTQPTKIQVARTNAKPITTPKPFGRLTGQPVRTEPRNVASPDDIELANKFRARPAPKTTYVPPPPRASPPATPMISQTAVGPPNLATMARPEKRQAVAEASRRSADAKALEKEAQAKSRQREKHEQDILKAETKTPPPPGKPFTLHSSLRHEAYQKQLAEKRAGEEEAARKQMDFHARTFKSPPAPERIHADHGPTKPKPFELSCVTRHEAFEHEKTERLFDEEEERKRRSTFKAKPVPKSTYVYKAISPKAGELVDPFSPELQSKQRAQERKDFDAQSYRDRMLTAARKKAHQDRIAAEEQVDLEERRRLPVSEGGMIPTAEPVNAVFMNG